MSGGWGSAWAGRVAVQRVAVLDPATSTPDRRAMAPTSELRPAVDALLAEFLRHLALERGRSAHTVRAYRADLTPLLDEPRRHRRARSGRAAPLARRRARGQGEPVHARAAGRRRPHLHRLGPSHRALARRDPGVRLVSPRPAAPCRPCSPRAGRRGARRRRHRGRGGRRRSRCATSRCSSCSTPPVCGWRSSAGSTWTTSTPRRRRCACSARATGSAPSSTASPPRRRCDRWLGGRPSPARQAQLAPRAAAGSPREAPGPAGCAQRRAPCGGRRARCSGRRPARSPTRRGDAHDGGRRGPSLRTGVARSR